MDNFYLLELINEAKNRGGGLILNFEDKPAVVVLTVEKYNELLNQSPQAAGKPWVKSKVLVTGGAGYVGGHLVKELIKAGCEVVVLDNLSTGKRENLDPKAVFIEGDLADENLLSDIFGAHKFEAVFHMAASLEVEESVLDPQKYFNDNVANTWRLLSAMAQSECKKIIFSSTAAVYGEVENYPIAENSPLRPTNPYGASKLLAERVIKFYCEYMGFQAVVFRYFNACGFDLEARVLPTHHSHLIHNVIQVAKGVRPALKVFGNDYKTFDGTCIRDYVHVTDIVLPHILALNKMWEGAKFETYNIGTGKGSSVAEVVSTASEVLNKIIPMEMGPRRAGDVPAAVADNSKLLEGLGYELKYSSLKNIITTSWEVMKDIN